MKWDCNNISVIFLLFPILSLIALVPSTFSVFARNGNVQVHVSANQNSRPLSTVLDSSASQVSRSNASIVSFYSPGRGLFSTQSLIKTGQIRIHKRHVSPSKYSSKVHDGSGDSLSQVRETQLENWRDWLVNVLLAEEEAKCLLKYGQLEPPRMDGIENEIFRAFICVRGSSKYFHCEQCVQLTRSSNVVNLDSKGCRIYCTGKMLFEDCLDQCANILKVLNKTKTAVSFHDLGVPCTGTCDSESQWRVKNMSVEYERSQISNSVAVNTSVFCEGVTTVDPKDSSSRHSADSKPTSSYRHFVYLKTLLAEDLNYVNSSEQSAVQVGASEPVVFVIEQREQISHSASHAREWTAWKTLRKSSFGLDKLPVTYHKATYQWRVTAVGQNGIIGTSVTDPFTTLDGYVEPGPPRRVYVVEQRTKDSAVDILLGWEPPKERACFYKIVLANRNEEEVAKTVRIKGEPLGVHKVWFRDLKFDSVYEVRITSRSADWHEDESTHAGLSFTTPTCLEVHDFRFDKCAPPPPRNVTYSIETVRQLNTLEVMGNPTGSLHFRRTFTVHLRWMPPAHSEGQNQVLSYIVDVRAFSWGVHSNGSQENFADLSNLMAPIQFNVSGNTTEITLSDLHEGAEYTVLVTAVSAMGSSPPATVTVRLYSDPRLVDHPFTFWMYPCAVFAVVLLVSFTCQTVRTIRQRRQIKAARDSYFKSMEQHDSFPGDWSVVSLAGDYNGTWKMLEENCVPRDKWDIGIENIKIGDVIGQGAFGVVRKAKMKREKYVELMHRRRNLANLSAVDERLICADSVADDGATVVVAVKMLKVAASNTDREDLMKELLTMQSLGSHPQIVTLLGICNTSRSLYLVMEYCPAGDLLTFLRKFRETFLPLLNLKCSSGEGDCETNGSRKAEDIWSTGKLNLSNVASPDVCYTDLQHTSETSTSSERFSAVPEGSELESLKAKEGLDECEPITEKDVLSYARQIALGMAYLERNHIIHRDLACRNILVMGDHKHVKISDFGLSRDVYTWNMYQQKTAGKLPFKWMAIESITSRIFTSKSDVWSYGIALWELVTLGAVPYPALENQELFSMLKSGYRMERPDNCSEELYALMRKCWRAAPADRPSFTELCFYLEAMIDTEPEMYLTLQP